MSNIRSRANVYIGLLKILFFLIFLIITNLALSAQEQESMTTRVLEDGTTITHTFNKSREIIREDIILKSGRHKTTYFDAEGKPKYGVVMTGTGSFGLMYYDQEKAPLFKFYDYGNNDTIIQFYSADFEQIGRIRMAIFDGERKIIFEEEKWYFDKGLVFIILSCLLGMIFGLFAGILISRRYHTE
jgi:hypothetical protein